MANTFVVDRTLGAVPVSRLLDIRAQLRVAGSIEKLTVVAGDRPIVTGDQALRPNVVFPSERSSGVGYYLPDYRVSTDEDGHPAVELRLKPGPDGEVGRLTIALTWTAPQASGVSVRPMDAIVTPALRYRIPVQGNAQSAGLERTTPLQPFASEGPSLLRSTTIFTDKGLFDAVYQAISQPGQKTTLDLAIRARVGMKTWRQVVVGQPTLNDQNKVLIRRGALFTEMVRRDHRTGMRTVPPAGTMTLRMMTAPAPAAPAAPAAPPRAVGTPGAAPRVLATPLILRQPMASPRVAAARPAAPAARLAVRASGASGPRRPIARRSRTPTRPG
jgi:hypothetical protein